MHIHRHRVPAVAPPSSRFAHGIEAEGHTRTLYVSGQLGVAPDGALAKSAEAQIERCWLNVLAVLADAGMGPANLVKVTGFLTRREDVRAYRDIRDHLLGGIETASTLVIVAGLVLPDALVEIEAIAVAP